MNSANSSGIPLSTSDESYTTHDGKEPPESHWVKQDLETEAAQQKITSQNLARIKKIAESLDADEPMPTRSYRLKQALEALAIPYTHALLEYALGQGQTLFDEPEDASAPFVVTDERWLWDGMVKAGEFNLVVARDKIGKSALVIHVLAASLLGKSECLGIPIHKQIDGLIIVGPDGNKAEWGKILRREGLLFADELDPRVKLWRKGHKYPTLNDAGIKHLCGACLEFERPALVLDTLYKVTRPVVGPKVEERSPDWMVPHQQLDQALTALDNETTLLTITHTPKGRLTEASGAARGTGQATGDASHILVMEYVTPSDEINQRTDYRRAVWSQGRDKGQALICDIADNDADGRWQRLGDAGEVMARENKARLLDRLTEGRRRLWNWARMITEEGTMGGTFTIDGAAQVTRLDRTSVWDAVRWFESNGFIQSAGTLPSSDAGGRPKSIFKLADEWLPNSPIHQEPPLTPQTPLTNDSYIEINGLSGKLGLVESLVYKGIPGVGAAVEYLHSDGVWRNGWEITRHSNSKWDETTMVDLRKHDNHALTRSDERWGADVRLVETVTPSEPEYDPEELF